MQLQIYSYPRRETAGLVQPNSYYIIDTLRVLYGMLDTRMWCRIRMVVRVISMRITQGGAGVTKNEERRFRDKSKGAWGWMGENG